MPQLHCLVVVMPKTHISPGKESRSEDGKQYYEGILSLQPSRYARNSLRSDLYSSTESDESDVETEEDRRQAEKKAADKIAKQYQHYKLFNVHDIIRVMAESGHKTDKSYVLAHSKNWRTMWGTALNILGKKKKYANFTPQLTSTSRISTPIAVHTGSTYTTSLPHIDPHSRQSNLTNSPLISHKQRFKSVEETPSANDHRSDDEETSITSSTDTTGSYAIRSRARKVQAQERKQQEKIERTEYLRKVASSSDSLSLAGVNLGAPSMSQDVLSTKKYGATSGKTCEVTATLRRIGRALEGFSRQERQIMTEVCAVLYCLYCAVLYFK